MQDSLAFSLFLSLKPKEIVRFGKFLNSPYFNRREDVLKLYAVLKSQSKKDTWDLEREKLWHLLFPDQKYERVALNYLLNFFAERLEALHRKDVDEARTFEFNLDTFLERDYCGTVGCAVGCVGFPEPAGLVAGPGVVEISVGPVSTGFLLSTSA